MRGEIEQLVRADRKRRIRAPPSRDAVQTAAVYRLYRSYTGNRQALFRDPSQHLIACRQVRGMPSPNGNVVWLISAWLRATIAPSQDEGKLC